MPYEHQDFERAKLYDEIWNEPVSKVSKRYGISDNGLRKICRELEVPIPSVGYWAKLAAGRTLEKTPLGETEQPTTYRRSVWKGSQDDEFEQRAHARLGDDAVNAPAIPEVAMQTSVDDCLPLVKRIAKKLGGKRRDSRDWPICEGQELMRVSVSELNSQRAVLVLNRLLETLIATGYSLHVGNKETVEAHVRILDRKITFRVRERRVQEAIALTPEQQAENERLKYNRHRQEYKYHPTNEIEIAAVEPGSHYARATIADTRTTTVESKIVSFVGRLREMVIPTLFAKNVEAACAELVNVQQ